MVIVTDQKTIKKIADLFSYVGTGEAKGFGIAEIDETIRWLSMKS